jgi:hypothetical protein
VVVDSRGDLPLELQEDGSVVFTADRVCVVSAHMDWPTDTDEALRRLDIRLDSGDPFNRRIAAVAAGVGSGDGYGFTSSGPVPFSAGDRVYVEVKQRALDVSVFQSTHLSWLLIEEY